MSKETPKEGLLKDDVTRRGFLAFGVVGLAGLGLSGCANQSPGNNAVGVTGTPSNVPESWDRECDVLVVGCGGGGAAAAIEAADSGANVLVVDASEIIGGATSINGGVLQAAGTSIQKEAGIEDSADAWFECLKDTIGPGFNEEHGKALTAAGADNVDWLVGLGAAIPATISDTATREIPLSGLYFCDASKEYFPDVAPTPRGHVVERLGAGFAAVLQSGLGSRGVEVLTQTSGESLVMDGAGNVVGITAKTTGGEVLAIKANKAVIVATGHFGINPDMAARYIPFVTETATTLPMMHPSATGGGHLMCGAVGAVLKNMGSGTLYEYNPAGFTETISMNVNAKGQRFFSEQGYHGNFRGTALSQQPGQVGLMVFDEAIRATHDELQAGVIPFSATTITELAEKCGIDPAALVDSVARYNAYCEAGRDLEFGKPAEFLKPITTPPFYANPLIYSWMTSGGMEIDIQGRVLDVQGRPIPKLYAAGLCAAPPYGRLNPGSGLNMAWNLYTGRLTGKSAASETAAS
jgi:succinate dehydrogenase/fumarate reductase flavoprotein subunit